MPVPDPHPSVTAGSPTPANGREVTRLRDLSSQQWRSGIAAWLGWLFDGFDMHLYTLVATPFVAQLLAVDQRDDRVARYGSIIQAAFLLGWAIGGGFFGRIGDRLGRSRALVLTILTYACFTGLSFFAANWWHLMLCRFLAALGIGGEWAVGAALLSETWPKRWRPWIAAVLQSAVNVGIIVAMAFGYLMASLPPRSVFLLGILPALIVLWIRRAVPEPEEWHAARQQSGQAVPSVADLFRGTVVRTTVLTILVCSLSLSAHWAFMYWYLQHLRNLPDLAGWAEASKTQFLTGAMMLVMATSVTGNFLAALIARFVGYRRTISWMCLAYFASLCVLYSVPRPHWTVFWLLALPGVSQGLFGLFTMYMPPLFPTLLRTTGAGFCYNIGRIVAAGGTVYFGLYSQGGDHRLTLLYAGVLFLPAALVALLLPEPPDEHPVSELAD